MRAVLLSVLVVAAIAALERRSRRPPVVPGRIVVVPFDNRTGDPAFDALGMIISDWGDRILDAVPLTTILAFSQSAGVGRYDPARQAELIGRGVRAEDVVAGSFYRYADSLRFAVTINGDDLRVPPVHVSDAERAIDNVYYAARRSRGFGNYYARSRIPSVKLYSAFVVGVAAYSARDFVGAAPLFKAAGYPGWELAALVSAREFTAADSLARMITDRRARVRWRVDELQAMRSQAALRNDLRAVYSWTAAKSAENPADDIAAYELALSALALRRPREAILLFKEMHPRYGALHGKPGYYLHYAAAHHLIGNHRPELRVVRMGLRARPRSLEARLANCRARAALGQPEAARAAVDALFAPEVQQSAELTVEQALNDCSAELDAHGLPGLAHWARDDRLDRDERYERGYVLYEQARFAAARADRGAALDLLWRAYGAGLPYYEAGRPMLHADVAFRDLRNTKGFYWMMEPRG